MKTLKKSIKDLREKIEVKRNSEALFWKKIIKLKDFVWNLEPDIRYLKQLLSSKILGDNKDYEKFIIISLARSGSGWMVDLLNSHPNIIAKPELYNLKGTVYGLRNFKSYEKRLDKLRKTRPIEFLEKIIFRKYRKKIKAVGLKILYEKYQFLNPRLLELREYIKRSNNMKIIHLVRENELKRLLSLKIASKTKKWHIKYNHEKSVLKPRLSYGECLESFKRVDKKQKEFDAFFKNHNVIEISYEDLCNNRNKELKKIQEFLKVPVKKLKSDKIKNESRRLSKAIKNYYELKNKFKNTKYGKYFED